MTGLTVLSLVLFVAIVALWVRSYSQGDLLVFTDGEEGAFRIRGASNNSGALSLGNNLVPNRGYLDFGWSYHQVDPWSRSASFDIRASRPSARTFWVLGFGYHSDYSRWSDAAFLSTYIFIPHYFLALLFAILPLLRLRSIVRNRRLRRVGHCPACGYDLRASPERCPECGTAATKLGTSSDQQNPPQMNTDAHG